jgi:hypothetical protein
MRCGALASRLSQDAGSPVAGRLGDGTVALEPVDPALHGVPLLVPPRVEGVGAGA